MRIVLKILPNAVRVHYVCRSLTLCSVCVCVQAMCVHTYGEKKPSKIKKTGVYMRAFLFSHTRTLQHQMHFTWHIAHNAHRIVVVPSILVPSVRAVRVCAAYKMHSRTNKIYNTYKRNERKKLRTLFFYFVCWKVHFVNALKCIVKHRMISVLVAVVVVVVEVKCIYA